jgi:hypothetical protein
MGDAITLRNEWGEYRGRVRIDRIKPGSIQGHWPEVNVLIPSGILDVSGAPDYNALVEVVNGHKPIQESDEPEEVPESVA